MSPQVMGGVAQSPQSWAGGNSLREGTQLEWQVVNDADLQPIRPPSSSAKSGLGFAKGIHLSSKGRAGFP